MAAAPAVLAVAGCAGPGGAGQPAPSLAGTGECFLAREAQDFRALGRGALLVYAPDRRHAYRVEVAPPSFDLRTANGIAFMAPGGRVCGYAGERVLLAGAAGRTELAIIDVRRLDPAALDAVGATGGGARPLPQPQPGVGADIEAEAADAPP